LEAALRSQSKAGEQTAAIEVPSRAADRPLGWREPQALRQLAWGHDRMFKPYIVQKLLDGDALRIGAAWRYVPIAMGVSRHVSYDDLAKCPPPGLRGATSLPDQAGDEQLFEVENGHALRFSRCR